MHHLDLGFEGRGDNSLAPKLTSGTLVCGKVVRANTQPRGTAGPAGFSSFGKE